MRRISDEVARSESGSGVTARLGRRLAGDGRVSLSELVVAAKVTLGRGVAAWEDTAGTLAEAGIEAEAEVAAFITSFSKNDAIRASPTVEAGVVSKVAKLG